MDCLVRPLGLPGAVHAVLHPRGLFVPGWNDTPDLVPVPLDGVWPLKRFIPCYFEPLNGTSFLCDTFRHTFSFYVKWPRRESR